MSRLIHLLGAGSVLALGLAMPQAFGQTGEDQSLQPRVIVDGDRLETDPGSVSFIDETLVSETLADHPAEILNVLPGVNIHTNSGQEHLIAIRSPVLNGGAGQGSFLILQNGVPTRSPAFGNVNMLFETHHEIADSIGVVRGPGSAAYGSNAVHGVVDLFLPSAETSGTDFTISS